MDVHQRPPDVDRRTLVRLAAGAVLLGTTVPVTAEEPVISESDVRSTLGNLQKLTANLASAYDEAGPAKVAAYVPKLRAVAARIVTDKSVPARLVTGAKAEYGKLLTLFAEAVQELGDHPRAINSGTMAASLAQEIGYPELEGRAWRCVSHSHLLSGRKATARNVARRAHGVARNWPEGVVALLKESHVVGEMGDKFAAFGLVTSAERAFARLPETSLGASGASCYEFGTLHPAEVNIHSGRSLVTIGMHSEAMPRLDEAAGVLAGTDSSTKACARLLQARCLLGMRDTDGALSLASMAVAQEASRPSAWVARYVRDLDKRSRSPRMTVGPFSDLVAQTARWGYGAT